MRHLAFVPQQMPQRPAIIHPFFRQRQYLASDFDQAFRTMDCTRMRDESLRTVFVPIFRRCVINATTIAPVRTTGSTI